MRTAALLLIALVAAASEPIETTLCDIHKNPDKFNGKTVIVRATVVNGFEASLLRDKTCDAHVWFEAGDREPMSPATEYARIKSEADLDHPQRLHWHPMPKVDQPFIVVKEDREFEKLKSSIAAFYQPERQVPCYNCPLYSVTATFTGRLDYTDRTWKALRGKDGKKLGTIGGGFGHLGASRFRLVMEAVKQVDAVPIDPDVYRAAETKRKR